MKTKKFKDFLEQYLQTDRILKAIFFEGPPGIGKTEIIFQMAKRLDYTAIIVHLGTKTIEHFSGLPMFADTSDGRRITVWSIPEIVNLCNTGKKTILFFDDIHLASEVVIKILFEALTDRSIHGVKLNDNVKIIAAMNKIESSMGSTITEIPEPVRNRYVKINVEPELDDWLEYATKIDVDPLVVSFLNFDKTCFYDTPEHENAQFATPRSWVTLSEYITSGFEMNSELIFGAIGKKCGIKFMSYYQVFVKYDTNPIEKWKDLKSYKEKMSYCAYLSRKLSPTLLNNYINDMIKDNDVITFVLLTIRRYVSNMGKFNKDEQAIMNEISKNPVIVAKLNKV